jgi:16S rRNA (guanine527-N7)-methyltransferase
MSRESRMRPHEGHPDARGAPLPTRFRRDQRAPLPTDPTGVAPLPSAYDQVLDEGLGDIGLELGAPVRLAIANHVRLLLAWTRAINLTAVREPADVARLHVLDSLSAVPTLRRLGVRRVLDLGSGGGMPGLPIALALPADEAVLVDSVAKKVRFLETAVAAIGAADRVTAVRARAEALALDPDHGERWDAVTARAVASLATLVELAFPLLRVGGVLVAWKRGDVDDELKAARRTLAVHGAGRIEVVDPSVSALPTHRLVVVTKDRPSPGSPGPRRASPRRGR